MLSSKKYFCTITKKRKQNLFCSGPLNSEKTGNFEHETLSDLLFLNTRDLCKSNYVLKWLWLNKEIIEFYFKC